MENKVVYLAHRNNKPGIETETEEILSCGTCKNKMWIIVYESAGCGFPRIKCACCGESAGYFGWLNKEE